MTRLWMPMWFLFPTAALAQSVWVGGTRSTSIEARAITRSPGVVDSQVNGVTAPGPFPREDRNTAAESLVGTPAFGTRSSASISYRVYGNTLRVEAHTRVAADATPPLIAAFGTANSSLRFDLVAPTLSTFTLASEQLESIGGGATIAFYSNNNAVLDRSAASTPIAPFTGTFQAGSIILVTGCSAFAETTGGSVTSTGTLRFELAIVSADYCAGDLDNDRSVDDADFAWFARAYELLLCDEPAMTPGCPSDLDGDGLVDDRDFVRFAAAYDRLFCSVTSAGL